LDRSFATVVIAKPAQKTDIVVLTETAACSAPAMAAALLRLSALIPLVSLDQSRQPSPTVAATSRDSSGVRLDGSRTSYAQFSTWAICPNAFLSLQFRTRQPTALLLYADDDRHRFVQMTLVRGRLRLRYQLTAAASTLPRDSLTTVGEGLSDGRWHTVRLRSPDGFRLVAGVDGAPESPASPRRVVARPRAGVVRLSTGAFVGGLPAALRRRPMDLAVPAVALERRLDGSVRRFRRSVCPGTAAGHEAPAELEAGRGMLPVDGQASDRCAKDRPCLHGGICVNTASGPLCECDRTDFDGMTCSIGLCCPSFIIITPV